MSDNLKSSATSTFSQMRAIGVPIGMQDPEHPNVSMTLWRTVADQGRKVDYFESVLQLQFSGRYSS